MSDLGNIVARLEAVATRLEKASGSSGASSASSSSGGAAADSIPASVAAFDALLESTVVPALKSGDALGNADLSKQVINLSKFLRLTFFRIKGFQNC
jgi:hypothetical protein